MAFGEFFTACLPDRQAAQNRLAPAQYRIKLVCTVKVLTTCPMPALVMPQQPKIHTNSSAISFAAQVMKFPSDGAREGFDLLLVRHVTHLVRDSSQAWPDSDRAIIFASLLV
jgi:hypothetical protein